MAIRNGFRTLAFLALPCGLIVSAGTAAAPLDKAACAKLAQDVQNMKALNVDKLMENGPQWAIAHLSPADITLIREYIDLDEQMRFRCSAPGSLVHLKHLDDEEEDGAKPSAEAGDEKAKKPQSGDSSGEETAPKKKTAPKPAAKAQASAVTH